MRSMLGAPGLNEVKVRLRGLASRLRDVDNRSDPLSLPRLADILGAPRVLGCELGDADACACRVQREVLTTHGEDDLLVRFGERDVGDDRFCLRFLHRAFAGRSRTAAISPPASGWLPRY